MYNSLSSLSDVKYPIFNANICSPSSCAALLTCEHFPFFNYEPKKWDIIVSNPPFSIKDKVLERLYSFNKPFAVLLPLNSLQGKTRYKYFKDGIQILSFDARICYHNKEHMDSVVKGSPFATAYFCRDLLPKDLIVEKLVTYERPLGE